MAERLRGTQRGAHVPEWLKITRRKCLAYCHKVRWTNNAVGIGRLLSQLQIDATEAKSNLCNPCLCAYAGIYVSNRAQVDSKVVAAVVDYASKQAASGTGRLLMAATTAAR